MNIVILTGIFPPDIGGPATHAQELKAVWDSKGHQVRVVTLWDGPQTQSSEGVIRFPRGWHWSLREAAAALWLVRNKGTYEVVYATGLYLAAALGGKLTGRPVIAKVVGDPAWERGRRLGLTDSGFDAFQEEAGDSPRLAAMRKIRNWSFRSAAAVVSPSRYLASVAEKWLPHGSPVAIIPNGIRLPSPYGKKTGELGGLQAIYIGRLIPHKHVDILVRAIGDVPGVSLHIVGEGPEKASLESLVKTLGITERVQFLGPQPRERLLESLASSHTLLLASSYEGLPHVAIEALATGTPVIAPSVGGLEEVIENESNGLILSESSAGAFASALSRLRDNHELRNRLSRQAAADAPKWSLDNCAKQLEELIAKVLHQKPEVIFFGKGSLPWPMTPDVEKKLKIITSRISPIFLTSGSAAISRVKGAKVISLPSFSASVLGSFVFYSFGGLLALFHSSGRNPKAVCCQSPYEGFSVLLLSRCIPPGMRPRVLIELHGDYRTASRSYGSKARIVLSPLSDRAAVWALSRADRVRVVSEFLADQVREAGFQGPVDKFIAFSDFEMFGKAEPAPLPPEPRVAFIGAFEKSKGIDILIEALASVARRLPECHFLLAGTGRQLSWAKRVAHGSFGPRAEFLGNISREQVVKLLDHSSLLVLPSRSEGLPRVIFEAFSRGRPVVASRVGGVPDALEDGQTGLLVPPEDPESIAKAVIDLLQDRPKLTSMGKRAREEFLRRNPQREFENWISALSRWAGRLDGG